MGSENVNAAAVSDYLKALQKSLCEQLLALDPTLTEQCDDWQRPVGDRLGGGGISRAFSGGDIIEKGGVNFSSVSGKKLPPSATAERPELEGRSFEALGVSVVIHPRNPYAPTSHCNVRFFIAHPPEGDDSAPVWWFGGGYDLTPYYGFDEDCQHWHQTAKNACEPFGAEVYPTAKKRCDEYFYIKHRNEPRGIGGVFFDDLNEWGFDKSFAFTQAIGDSYFEAYLPIVKRRIETEYGQRQRNWQCIRRGRYVEFNLVWDRGTLFGLQSGGRTESILMSMPPEVQWAYAHEPEEGSAEAALMSEYLVDKSWL